MQRLSLYMSSAHMHCSKDWVKCVEHAAALGFDGVELFAGENGVNFTELSAERLARVAEAARKHSITLSVHPWVNWAVLDPEPLRERYRRLFTACADMGVHEVNMHMEFLTDRKTGLERLFDATDACLDLLHGYGITLYYENVPSHGADTIGSRASDFDALFERYADESAVMMNIDSGHAHIGGILDMLAEKHGSRWKYTHVHDNEGAEDQHLAPGGGTIDFFPFAASAARADYRGPLMMEYSESGLGSGLAVLRGAFEAAGYFLPEIKTDAET